MRQIDADHPDAVAYLRRAAKPRVDKGCTSCSAIVAPPVRVNGLTDIAFNPSIAVVNGTTWLAFRHALCGSSIFVVPLDAGRQPLTPPKLLRLSHPRCLAGQEDPRFFWWQGRLHIAFSGVELVGQQTVVHLLHAELDSDLNVVRTWQPQYAARATWEKNWGAFEVEDTLYSVYMPSPVHVVLRHDGDTAVQVAGHHWRPPFMLRGGASPVRVGDEFWCFAHTPKYELALYTFGLDFAPERLVPRVLLADRSVTRPRNEKPAIYPCGAVQVGEHMLVSYGLHNSHCEVAEFDMAILNKAMVNV